MQKDKLKEYWRKNITYVIILLIIWFIVSFGLGVIFVDELDAMGPVLGGFKLGFWFAQIGSEVVFVFLILIYVGLMNALDREFDVHED